jgi:hypothetical protein
VVFRRQNLITAVEGHYRFLRTVNCNLKGAGNPVMNYDSSGAEGENRAIRAPAGNLRDAVATRSLLDAAVRELMSMNSVSALVATYQNLQGGKWDITGGTRSVLGRPSDKFTVDCKILTGGEFGNYFAGYVTEARFGDVGSALAAIGGDLDALVDAIKNKTPLQLDEPQDQALIMQGARDAKTRMQAAGPEPGPLLDPYIGGP